MLYNPLEQAEVIENPGFHEYHIILKNYDISNLIEDEYIWYLKADEIKHNENILQSITYQNNILTVKFSGPEPTDETIEWIDSKIDRLMKKVNSEPTY
ncbi:MAG: hypothetical protein KJ906_00165 [Nanoarchaeota archaeon]|nr:hypothetical protein [Nanoarchaeota archaeon]